MLDINSTALKRLAGAGILTLGAGSYTLVNALPAPCTPSEWSTAAGWCGSSQACGAGHSTVWDCSYNSSNNSYLIQCSCGWFTVS